MAGAQQLLKQSPTWVFKNIAKQHLTVDGGGFQTDDKRPLGFWRKGGFWLDWSLLFIQSKAELRNNHIAHLQVQTPLLNSFFILYFNLDKHFIDLFCMVGHTPVPPSAGPRWVNPIQDDSESTATHGGEHWGTWPFLTSGEGSWASRSRSMSRGGGRRWSSLLRIGRLWEIALMPWNLDIKWNRVRKWGERKWKQTWAVQVAH